ncbi:MAG: type I glyceraldehyde-3-phosphate dehydrogenase [Bacilli bacterium]|nr:MAG: type I glyceraldehyde-3-phosphate dehydrogenase [Bacilli bacterium]
MRIAINGFGRIGRLVYRIMSEDNFFDIVAINDLSSSEELAYLLKYDTNHRTYNKNITFDNEGIIVNNKKTKVFSETDPSNLPWKELGIDLVFECTGKFTKEEDALKHVLAGAKKVLISAPGKGDMKTIVYNVNDDILDDTDKIVSAASCTTNCLAPVLKIIDDNFGIERGFMTTIHAYTNDQVTLDVSHKKGIRERRGRACAMNMVPTSTGAATAIGKVIPSLDGKLSGGAIRVPISDGSLIDLSLELTEKVTVEEINSAFINKESETLMTTTEPIVSSDVIGTTCGALVDLSLTKLVEHDGKQMVKVIAWYDNEMGYSAQMVRTAKKLLER